MENSDNEDDGNLDNLEDLDEEQMGKLLQLQVCNFQNHWIMWNYVVLNNIVQIVTDGMISGADRAWRPWCVSSPAWKSRVGPGGSGQGTPWHHRSGSTLCRSTLHFVVECHCQSDILNSEPSGPHPPPPVEEMPPPAARAPPAPARRVGEVSNFGFYQKFCESPKQCSRI